MPYRRRDAVLLTGLVRLMALLLCPPTLWMASARAQEPAPPGGTEQEQPEPIPPPSGPYLRADPNSGYGMLLQASEMYKSTPDKAADYQQHGRKAGATDAERKRLMKRKAAALNLARAACKVPYRMPPVLSTSDVFPEMAGFRELARAFALEGDVYAAENSPKAAASRLDAIALGAQIQQGGVMIHRLVGIACEAIGRKGLWEQLPGMDADAARYALRRLQSLPDPPPLSESLANDKRAILTTLRESFAESRRETEAAVKRGEMKSPPVMPTDDEMERYLALNSERYDALIAASQRPFRERAEDKVLEHYSGEAGEVRMAGQPLPLMMMPMVTTARMKAEGDRAENALLLVALALRAYQADYDDYPEELTALTKTALAKVDGTKGERKYLARLPLDPFADAKPVRYRRLSADKYLLYSVGPDGYDDHGKPLYTPDVWEQERSAAERAGKPVRSAGKNQAGDIVVGVNVGPESLAPNPPKPEIKQ